MSPARYLWDGRVLELDGGAKLDDLHRVEIGRGGKSWPEKLKRVDKLLKRSIERSL